MIVVRTQQTGSIFLGFRIRRDGFHEVNLSTWTNDPKVKVCLTSGRLILFGHKDRTYSNSNEEDEVGGLKISEGTYLK